VRKTVGGRMPTPPSRLRCREWERFIPLAGKACQAQSDRGYCQDNPGRTVGAGSGRAAEACALIPDARETGALALPRDI